MSSAHYIIVARQDTTGKIELPLGDMTIYGCEPEGEEEMFQRIRKSYGDDWTLAWYQPKGSFWFGGRQMTTILENYTQSERQDEYWAGLWERCADDHREMVKGWLDRKDYAMALRCSIFAEAYDGVASSMRQPRNVRIERDME